MLLPIRLVLLHPVARPLVVLLPFVRRADMPDHGGRRGVPLPAPLHGAGDVLGPGAQDIVLS